MYHLYFYVPESHLDTVKNALFAKGAGRFGNYDCCCWQTLGTGQYRPLAGSEAYYGEINKIETIQEYKVELVCRDDIIDNIIDELKKVHPYEEVAYGVWQLRTDEK